MKEVNHVYGCLVFFFLCCACAFYIMVLVWMQYKCLLVKKVTKRILQTFNSRAHYLDGLNLNNIYIYIYENIYPFLHQGIAGMSHILFYFSTLILCGPSQPRLFYLLVYFLVSLFLVSLKFSFVFLCSLYFVAIFCWAVILAFPYLSFSSR